MRNKKGHGIVYPGAKFGRLTVIGRAGYKKSSPCWLVECECGVSKVVYHQQLTSNPGTKSCGCLARELSSKRKTKHGACKHGKSTQIYQTWTAMTSRCRNPMAAGYLCYGGRGISVCERWVNSFQDFLADVGERPPGHSLDRIDVNGNYEPGNVRWATASEQQANRRCNPRYEYNGMVFSVQEACEFLGISRSALRSRIRKLGVEGAFSMKKHAKPIRVVS